MELKFILFAGHHSYHLCESSINCASHNATPIQSFVRGERLTKDAVVND